MKSLLLLLTVCILTTGCSSLFEVPDKSFDAPAAPKTASDKNMAWAADKVSQKRAAEREQFQQDLKASTAPDAN